MKLSRFTAIAFFTVFSLTANGQDLFKLFETLGQQKVAKYQKERDKFRNSNMTNYRVKDRIMLDIADMAYDMLILGETIEPETYEAVYQRAANVLDRQLEIPFSQVKSLTDPLVYSHGNHVSLE